MSAEPILSTPIAEGSSGGPWTGPAKPGGRRTGEPARPHESNATEAGFALIDGTVLLTEGKTAVVRTAVGDVRAERAESCLLAVEPRDRVLLSRSSTEAFVLAVLARPGAGPARIETDRALEVVSKGGKLTLIGPDEVAIMGAKTKIATGELAVRATRATAHVDELGFFGKVASFGVTALRVTSESVERTATRAVERLGRSYRFIENTENVRARDLDVRTENTVSLRGENAVVLARKIVKMDGTQIHMG